MSTYSVGKDIQALVADIGSFSTKIGYAGDDHPQAVYNSTTAVVRNSNNNNNNNAQGSTSSCFLKRPKRDFNTRPVEGEKVGDGSYELVNPVDEATGWLFSAPSRSRFGGGSSLTSNEADNANTNVGVGGNDDNDGNDRLGDAWESHELVSQYLHHSFQNALGLDVPADSSLDYAHNHPLLLLDKPHTPPALRQRILEILFETHDLPAVFVLRDAIASCYAVGRTTATVVDVGYSAAVVTPVYEGFVETRGVRRNVACGARATEERVLRAMDGIVRKQGGRRRKDRMRRRDQRRLEREQGASAGANSNNVGEQRGEQQQQEEAQAKRPSAKRDKHGHFIKESTALSQSLAPIPDYLMPLYQVRRAPKYTTRTTPFHEWSRLTLARDIKEMGLGAAVGPTGYVSSAAAAAAKHAAREGEGENSAADALNPATANNLFLQSSKLPYTLPDGTPVEITTASRCDVVEVFFGNDEENVQYREQKLDEAMNKLDEYEADIENYLNQEQKMEEDDNAKQDAMAGITSSESAAGDPYSKTSYKGEKLARGRSSKQMHYSPGTISNKLYAACLPYVRTAPAANLNNNESGLDGGDKDTSGGGVNDNYYHYLTSAPPAQMVCDAAFRCDRDQQAALLGNVVVCGGGACITGAANVGGSMGAGTSPNLASALGDEHAFPDRLREEIEGIVHRHTPGWRVKVTSPNISERAICGWLGGSILGSLGTFRDMWISKRDYEEFGSAIVNRKCP